MSEALANDSGAESSGSWVMAIHDRIEEEMEWLAQPTGVKEITPICTIFRVPKRARIQANMDKDTFCFTPESISLGLFHRPGRYVAPKRGENFKVKMATAFLATIYMSEDRRKESLARLQSNPALAQQVADLVARPREECKDASLKTDIGAESRVDSESVRVITLGLRDHVWRGVCDSVVGKPTLALTMQLYNLEDDDVIGNGVSEEELQCVLTLDAISVAVGLGVFYLGRGHPSFPFPLFSDRLEQEGNDEKSVVLKLFLDFLKVENQIPLQLLRNVMRMLYNEKPTGGEKSRGDAALNLMCSRLVTDICQRVLPGFDNVVTKAYITRLEEKQMFLECDHLLDCISLVVRVDKDGESERQRASEASKNSLTKYLSWMAKCGGLSLGCLSRAFTKDEEKCLKGGVKSYLLGWCFNSRASGKSETRPTIFNIPSATRLREAGIEFKYLPRGVTSDLLPIFTPGWLRATLYIPKLPRFSILTITIWKNVLVYESRTLRGTFKSESQLFAIMAFMDSLIDTKEDVLVLAEGHDPVLPDRYSSAPEDLARMFNTILVGFPIPAYPRWVALKRQIVEFHNQRYRRMVLDFVRTYFGKPWLIISVTAASVLVILTFLQTIYAMLSYYP